MGVTGASGALYARCLLDELLDAGVQVHLIVSPRGRQVVASELGTDVLTARTATGDHLTFHHHDDLFSPLASGTYPTDGMVVCPCSCNTLAAIASGLGDNLLTRAAHVHLKERRPLVLCIREMPLTPIDLENLLRVGRAGAVVCPAAPAFYGRPESLNDLVRSVVGKLLDLLGVPNDLTVRWDASAARAARRANQGG